MSTIKIVVILVAIVLHTTHRQKKTLLLIRAKINENLRESYCDHRAKYPYILSSTKSCPVKKLSRIIEDYSGKTVPVPQKSSTVIDGIIAEMSAVSAIIFLQ